MRITQRKKRVPIGIGLPIEAKEVVPKFPDVLRKEELHRQYPHIPLIDIYVDPTNGVELFRNVNSGGWCYKPSSVNL